MERRDVVGVNQVIGPEVVGKDDAAHLPLGLWLC